MLRCSNCGYGGAQYGRHAAKHGFSGCRCSAMMSDTEYDNASDDDDDWMMDSAPLPPASDRFRTQNFPDRRLPPRDRYSSRHPMIQPVQAELKFHNNGSFDGDSVCSGTFMIDLSTLQAIQNRCQPTAAFVNQPHQLSAPRSRPSRRSHTAMAPNEPEPVPYGREPGYRVPYSYPHVPNQRPFPNSRNFYDDSRKYEPAPRTYRDFEDDHGGFYEPFQNCRDYGGGSDRNQYRCEPTSYSNVQDDYGYHARDCSGSTRFRYFADHTEVDNSHRRLPRVPNGVTCGERRNERYQSSSYDDEAPSYRSADPDHRCCEPNFNDRREDYPQQAKDRYDYVPTHDVPAPHINERSSYTRSQTSSYQAPRPGPANQPRNWDDYVSPTSAKHDEGGGRYCSSDSEPGYRPETSNRDWKSSRFQDEPGNRHRSPSVTRPEPERLPPANLQPRPNQMSDSSRREEFPSFSPESYPYKTSADQAPDNRRRQDESNNRSRNSSTSREESQIRPQVQSRQNQFRDGSSTVSDFPTSRSRDESINRSRSSSASRQDTRRHSQEQSRQNQFRDSNTIAMSSTSSHESQPYGKSGNQEPPDSRWKGTQFEANKRSRSASVNRQESDRYPPFTLEYRQNQTTKSSRDEHVNTESQPSKSLADHRSDIRRGNNSFSVPMKVSEAPSRGRPSSRGVNPTRQDDPEIPDFVSRSYRSSSYQDGQQTTEQTGGQDMKATAPFSREKPSSQRANVDPSLLLDVSKSSDFQEGQRKAGQTGEQDTKHRVIRRSSLSGKKAESLSSERRHEDKGRRVKFQSDPNLSHKDENDFYDSRPSSADGGATISDKDQPSSGRRYQSLDSLQDSYSQPRGPEYPENSERRYSSQTSLAARSRSMLTERKHQPVHRTRSADQVDQVSKYPKDPSTSRDSSRDRRRALPRAPINSRRTSDDDQTSSVIRDVTSEIVRMTSSVNSIESKPPNRPSIDDSGRLLDRGGKNQSVKTASQAMAESASHLTMSTSDLDLYSSTQSGLGIRKRLEEQKRKKMEQRRKGGNV